MLGAIIGDVAGSTYEVDEVKKVKEKLDTNGDEKRKILDKENTPLFREGSTYTDDSILSIAIADALLNGAYFPMEFEEYLKNYGLQEISLGEDSFGRGRFGKGFYNWLLGDSFTNSYGNGCAMRISAVPMYCDTLNQIHTIAHNVTVPTHDHEESYQAVYAVCLAIYYAKKKKSKEFIKKEIEEKCGYNLNFDLTDLQDNYRFTSRAKDSIPQAIFCFLESDDFEDAIRKAISIGGDADTIAAITGSIAENYYGIPQKIKDEVKPFITEHMNEVLVDFYSEVYYKESLIKKGQKYNNNNYKRRIKTNNGRKN